MISDISNLPLEGASGDPTVSVSGLLSFSWRPVMLAANLVLALGCVFYLFRSQHKGEIDVKSPSKVVFSEGTATFEAIELDLGKRCGPSVRLAIRSQGLVVFEFSDEAIKP